jgi:hypothetical protein
VRGGGQPVRHCQSASPPMLQPDCRGRSSGVRTRQPKADRSGTYEAGKGEEVLVNPTLTSSFCPSFKETADKNADVGWFTSLYACD